ncbi:hypothetical protein HEQ75_24645 [Roseomonas sp. BU-1]|uniref:Invasion associated locus B family protein n=1 Tax=Falsiroseomonas selenitidurans TaxID=2716335 RepID=A0ABX1EA22_9PROT|nr:hypothetical protein [Falsiroseomonas selenitidurans]
MPPPPPQAPAQPGAAGPGWRMACAEPREAAPRDCQVATRILARADGPPLAGVVLTRQRESRSLTLLFQIPHGAFLPAGLGWQVDEAAAQRLPFQASDAAGLYVAVAVTDAVLATLRAGTTLKLSFVVAARREALALPIPLAGFDAAVAAMLSAERAPG